MNNSPKPAVILLFLFTAVIFISLVANFVPRFNPDVSCCDHLFYRSMAYNLFRETRPQLNRIPPGNCLSGYYKTAYWSKIFHTENQLNYQPPYVYRIFSPLVARSIGWLFFNDNLDYGFYALTFISLVLSGFFITLIIYNLNKDIICSILGALAFSSLWFAVPWNLFHYMLVDATSFLFILVAIFFMLKRKKTLFYLICLLGVFNKETIFFVLPCYLLSELFEGKRASLVSFSWIVSIATIYLIFRAIIPIPVNTYSLRSIIWFNFHWKQLFSIPFLTFGALIFFALSRMWLSRFSLSLLPLALMSYISICLVSDKERVMIYAFPFVLLSVFGLRFNTKKERLLSLTPLFVYFCLNFIQDWWQFRFRIVFLIGLIIFVIIESFFLGEYFKIRMGG